MNEFNPQRKIITRPAAVLIATELRKRGYSLVFTNGCFDILHPGHIDLFAKARCLGDGLMVGLNTDCSIQRLKGPTRPIMKEESRALMLAALEAVDWVVLFDEDTPEELIGELLPAILVKGGDYSRETVVGHEAVEAAGGRVEIIPIVPGHSTTAIFEKLMMEELG